MLTAPARVLNDFAKTHKKLELKSRYSWRWNIMMLIKLKQLASIPSKDVLIAKLLGSFKAPLSNFAYVLNAIAKRKVKNSWVHAE